jgi:hypothetical protein
MDAVRGLEVKEERRGDVNRMEDDVHGRCRVEDPQLMDAVLEIRGNGIA